MAKPKQPLPSQEQARQGVIVCARNAVTQMILGTYAAQTGARGQAISLLILGLEEAVKARALMAYVRVQGSPEKRALAFPEVWLDDVLHRSHRRRHRLALYQGVSDEMRTYLLGLRAAPPKQIARDLDYAEWLERADGLKQKGLYATFDGTSWRDPQELVTDDDLRQTTYYCLHFIQATVAQAENHKKPGEILPRVAPIHVHDDRDPIPRITFSPPNNQ